MAELGWILALPAILVVVGSLFAIQYKLAVKERKWLGFIIPAIILLVFIGFSTVAFNASHSFEVRVLEGADGHGNTLKLTIQQPKNSDTVTHFSELMIYNKEDVLVDKLFLHYNDNKPESSGDEIVYDRYIQSMLDGIKLDGTSWEEDLIVNGVPFMGMMFGGDPLKALVVVFGVPFVMILFAGILPRILNRKKIRDKALAKVDIQSLEEYE